MTKETHPIFLALYLAACLFLAAGCSPDSDQATGGGLDEEEVRESIQEKAAETNDKGVSVEDREKQALPEKPADARAITITARNFYYEPDRITAKPGEKLYVKLINEAKTEHMWQVRGLEGSHIHAPGGSEGAAIFNAPEQTGEYSFFCGVMDHKDIGMTGTLVVTASTE